MDVLNREFVRLIKVSGWSQKEVARQLDLTPGAVSHIVNGRNRPSQAVVRLFKLVLESQGAMPDGPADRKRLQPWEEDLLRKMRGLKQRQRDRVLDALHSMVSALSDRGSS